MSGIAQTGTPSNSDHPDVWGSIYAFILVSMCAAEIPDLPGTKKTKFDPARYMAAAGVRRRVIHVKTNLVLFA